MDKNEARVKHNKNAKYRQRSNNNKETDKAKEDKQITQQILPNNWSKYEISEETEEQTTGADYETLLQEPVSQDSFFKFKSEQNWDNDIGQMQLSKYFTLDLKLLSEGIMCVPFTKRQDIDRTIFSVTELDNFDKNANTYLTKYEKYLRQRYPAKIVTKSAVNEPLIRQSEKTEEINLDENLENNITKGKHEFSEEKNTAGEIVENVRVGTKNNISLISKQPREIKRGANKSPPEKPVEIKKETVAVVEVSNKSSKQPEDEVDELLSLKIGNTTISDVEPDPLAEDPLLASNITVKSVAPQSAVDLEQWLDDILDD